MKRVDPEGVEKRRLKKGKVRAHLDIYEAFEVVQMDGHFKLPWGLHVVSAIDVATLMPILIKVVDNKHSMVMLHLYREAVRSFGSDTPPRCLHVDKGKEWSEVIKYQAALNNASFSGILGVFDLPSINETQPSSELTGSSTCIISTRMRFALVVVMLVLYLELFLEPKMEPVL